LNQVGRFSKTRRMGYSLWSSLVALRRKRDARDKVSPSRWQGKSEKIGEIRRHFRPA
jgi:hypothetical protein